jgi:hypothetical protein
MHYSLQDVALKIEVEECLKFGVGGLGGHQLFRKIPVFLSFILVFYAVAILVSRCMGFAASAYFTSNFVNFQDCFGVYSLGVVGCHSVILCYSHTSKALFYSSYS